MTPSTTPVPTPHHTGAVGTGWTLLILFVAVGFFALLLWSAYTWRGDRNGGTEWN